MENKNAVEAMENLLNADESQLYEQLGLRAKAISENPEKAGSFAPEVTYDESLMGPKEILKDLGQRLFQRWNVEAYNLICGADDSDAQDRKDIANAFGINQVMVGAAISGILVANFGLAPAIAAVIAAIALKRFFRPGYEEFCKVWKKNLPDAEQ